MRALASFAVLAGCLASATPAFASTASVEPERERSTKMLQIAAAPARANEIRVIERRTDVVVKDPAGVSAGSGCRQIERTRVACRNGDDVIARVVGADSADHITIHDTYPPDNVIWHVYGGAGADRIEGTGKELHEAHGGPGDDVLVGPTPTRQNTFDGLNALSGDGGNDRLVARSGLTTLLGGEGDDRLEGPAEAPPETRTEMDGGPGADRFTGGDQGRLVLDYDERTEPIFVAVDGKANDGAAGEGDFVGTGVDMVRGGSGNDVLRGGDGPDELLGAYGDDVLDGRGGDDYLRGSAGDDRMHGGNGADRLTGDVGQDLLEGQSGDDLLESSDGRTSGPDQFAGGEGVDTVSYDGSSEGVAVDLEGDPDDGPADKGDLVAVDIENILGSEHDDVLTGNDGANRLTPGTGVDVIDARAGDDVVQVARGRVAFPFENRPGYLVGDSGPDRIHGGDGSDTIDYSAALAARVDLSQPGAPSGTSTQPQELFEVENVVGSHAPDHVTGGPGPNVLFTGASDDVVVSRPSDRDTIDCGVGTRDVAEVTPGGNVRACELVHGDERAPRVSLLRKPISASTPEVVLTFSESWVEAELVLTDGSSGRPLSRRFLMRAGHRRKKTVYLELTRHGTRLLKRRKAVRSVLTIQMRGADGLERTARVRRQLRRR